LWLPGGRVVYSSVRGKPPQLIGRDLATGKEDELVPGGGLQQAQTVSPDGQLLLYTIRGQQGFFDIWKYPLSGAGKPAAFLESPFDKSSVRFSPDGRFLAMITEESGRPEVYVTAFPGQSERIRVSTGGAGLLRWSRDGRELFYVSSDRQLVSVPIRTTPSLELGTPTLLFTLKGRGSWPDFEVTPDGRRVLAIVPEIIADELPLTVVANWTTEATR
jgi:Tol biopolymer transport system component